jgi:acetyltransferase-like isoleucine patch superfamily enzyme
MGTNIIDGIEIGSNTIIGAGSLVVKDIPSNVVAYGNPCRVIRDNVAIV